MAAFASAGELMTLHDEEDLDEAWAQLILDVVSDQIRDALGWSVTQENVTVTLDGPGTEELLLPTLHLTSVTSVTENGRLLEQGDDFLLYQHGKLRRVVSGFGIDWTDRPQGITVVFTHGYPADAVPGVFRAVTLDYAGKMLSNPALVPHSRTVGRVTVSYSDMRAMVPPIDDSRLDTYRLPEGF